MFNQIVHCSEIYRETNHEVHLEPDNQVDLPMCTPNIHESKDLTYANLEGELLDIRRLALISRLEYTLERAGRADRRVLELGVEPIVGTTSGVVWVREYIIRPEQ